VVQSDLPDTDALNPVFVDLAPLDAITPLEWRTEVMDNGQRYIFRKGSRANRRSHPGGRFDTLSEERKRQYERNKRKHHRSRKAKKASAKAATRGPASGASPANPEQSRRPQRAPHRAHRLPARRDRARPGAKPGRITPAA
jgi:hypothetical protein